MVRTVAAFVAICLVLAGTSWGLATPPLPDTSVGSYRNNAVERWLDLVAEYAKSGVRHGRWDPVPVDVPVAGKYGEETLPVLLVPVPVPISDYNAIIGRKDLSQNILESRPLLTERGHEFRITGNVDDVTKIAVSETPVSSEYLLQLFKEQLPVAPELPPAVFPPYSTNLSPQLPKVNVVVSDAPVVVKGVPPLPRFDNSLMLRGELTVHSADYTEPYVAWWDAASGATRIDFHGGATSSFHVPKDDGRVQFFQTSLYRADGPAVRRCAVSDTQRHELSRTAPALPDLEGFTFGGYERFLDGTAERWERTVRGQAGELGAAPGESLTFHHQLLVRRTTPDGNAVPLEYKVSVDSSVLGPASDGYTHRYLEAWEQAVPQDILTPEVKCDSRETLDIGRADHRARLDPMREFTMLVRDPRYDDAIEKYKKEFDRTYSDNIEEAMRKNLFIQSSRFVASNNRAGATFEVEVNFLGDRLDAEYEQLLGVPSDVDDFDAEQFPYDEQNLSKIVSKLPKEFDWRKIGAVSEVPYQDSCSSCWAFSVAGAVEGALFKRTQRLVPLSPQALVDCGYKHGANGCKGTWPTFAYKHVQVEGLQARDEYRAYVGKKLTCQEEVPPITHISGHVNVTNFDVDALKVAIKENCPNVVVIDSKADSFKFYKKGVLYDDRCQKKRPKLDHAVLAVGYGEDHFILKNWWSAAWGEEGYIRVDAQSNTCGVLALPSYPRLERSDIDRLPGGQDLGSYEEKD